MDCLNMTFVFAMILYFFVQSVSMQYNTILLGDQKIKHGVIVTIYAYMILTTHSAPKLHNEEHTFSDSDMR